MRKIKVTETTVGKLLVQEVPLDKRKFQQLLIKLKKPLDKLKDK